MNLNEALKTLKNAGYLVESEGNTKIYKITSSSNNSIKEAQQSFFKYMSNLLYHPLVIDGSLYIGIDGNDKKANYIVRQLTNQLMDCDSTELEPGSEEYNNIIETFEQEAGDVANSEDDRF